MHHDHEFQSLRLQLSHAGISSRALSNPRVAGINHKLRKSTAACELHRSVDHYQ